MTAAIEPSACPNCGAMRSDAYCAVCGQKAAPLNPTLVHFAHELMHELLHVDGKIFRSVLLLLTRPGFLTQEQFAGRRARYVSPIRLYLIFSVLFFAVMQFTPSGIRVQLKAGDAVDPQQIQQRTQEAIAAVNDVTHVWLPRVMFLLVPVFGGIVMLFRRRSGHHYPQHLYFALHVHSAWFFALTIGALVGFVEWSPLQNSIAVLNTLYVGIYLWFAFRRAYGTTLLGALWRTLVIGVAYWLVTIGTLLAIWLPPVVGIFKRV
jgi:hypothetical protein